MKSNKNTLVEMIKTADYAAMEYEELLHTKNAMEFAIGYNINSHLDEKRADKIKKITHAYVMHMNAYSVTKEEVVKLLESETFDGGIDFSKSHDDVDDQSSTSECNDSCKTVENKSSEQEDSRVNKEGGVDAFEYWTSLAEKDDVSTSAGAESASPEAEAVPEADKHTVGVTADVDAEETDIESEEVSLVNQAIEKAKSGGLPDNIDTAYPYFVDYSFSTSTNGDIRCSMKVGKNASVATINEMKHEDMNYAKMCSANMDIESGNDYLAYKVASNEEGSGEACYKVIIYHIPEDGADYLPRRYEMSDRAANVCEDPAKYRKVIRKCLKEVESNYNSEDANASFYEMYRCSFVIGDDTMVAMQGHHNRVYVDSGMLPGIKDAFEKCANLRMKSTLDDCANRPIKNVLVVKTERSIAYFDILNDSDHIYVFTIHPTDNDTTDDASKTLNEQPQVAGSVASESHAATEVMAVPEIECVSSADVDILMKGVEISKSLPVSMTLDVNKPCFVQHDFSILNDGNVVYSGKPFCLEVVGDMVNIKNRHKRYAKTMASNAVVSTDEYTAYIHNGGKNMSVFRYHLNTAKS